jgi:hypothetical protein
MFENEADRLAIIQSLGGQLLRIDGGTFWAIFDHEYIDVGSDEPRIESTQPVLTCRTSDVGRLLINKDTLLEIEAGDYQVRRHEPDGTGMSRLILRLA